MIFLFPKYNFTFLCVYRRDNYGFVTFLEPEDARECIERKYCFLHLYLVRLWPVIHHLKPTHINNSKHESNQRLQQT